MPTIGIIDNFPVLRKGLMLLLRDHLKRAVFLDAKEPKELALVQNRKKPDILILGLNDKSQCDFQAALSQIKTYFPSTPVIIYDEDLRSDIVISYMQSELSGYVVKSTDPIEIVRCVEDVLSGRRYLCQGFTENILRSVYGDVNISRFTAMAGLTYSEYKIACQLAKGKSVETIARLLGQKTPAVERLAKRVATKLSVRSHDDLIGRMGQNNKRLANL